MMKAPPHRVAFWLQTATVFICGIVAAGVTGGCASAKRVDAPAGSVGGAGLGSHSRTVGSGNAESQRWFNDGLRWMFAFNHDEAVRSFRRAAEADASCAMAWWGVALCRGPHINNPFMSEHASAEAWDALGRARAGAAGCTPVERALIDALAERYVNPAVAKPLPTDPVSRRPLDKAYADAMADVHARFPQDDDVATLYAEALMDLRPWDLWSLDGQPRPETGHIVSALELVLARNPDHPGANHYYIHAVEASQSPERADAAATRLRTLAPGSGHLVHMPAHIDVRTGRWNLAADQNIAAMKVHEEYEKRSPRQGLYRAYMFHNEHFLSYACMMAGRSDEAIRAARGMVRSIPEDFYKDFAPVADAYTSIQVEALVRFGLWDQVLAEPEPRADLPVTRAMWRFARGVALAAKGDVGAGRAEQARFREAVSQVPAGAMMAINPAEKVLNLAGMMLEGELRYREGDLDGAVKHLKAAIEVEDTLQYIEPPDWVQPVRHALGAILLQSGRHADAAEVYREDLRRWPENGWSLWGLARCCEAQGKHAEAEALKARFAKAWSRADVKLETSCFCVRNGK